VNESAGEAKRRFTKINEEAATNRRDPNREKQLNNQDNPEGKMNNEDNREKENK
jgi:hypothetical protein